MIRLLTSVSVEGIRPETVLGIVVAHEVYRRHTDVMWVTSVTDGVHKEGSLHYKGLAADLRVKHIPEGVWERLRDELQVALGPHYDVLLERKPPHIHLEHDPLKRNVL